MEESTSLVSVMLRDRKWLLDWSTLHETSCLSQGPAGPHMPTRRPSCLLFRGFKNAQRRASTGLILR